MTAIHHSGKHRRSSRRGHLGCRLATASMFGAAAAAGWLLTAQIAEPQPALQPTPPQSAAGPAVPEHIQRAGQVIASSSNSFTTSTPDGQTTTFRITPDTAQIALPAVQKHVVVVGIVHEGIPVATAIADQGAVGPNGPPMDYELPT
ncbi:hypothetical protein [Mycobacterium sp. 236(2023)]|uniref:hypothetical protein n=1 Tax=Mycobacterium sp. 236(2023) TaxID=3038163 RepID=UPI0024159447|nr:hypothetical protein [Mycobacterium sp. 236(2023)]MDG4667058.1 hypothetical protein [Mycobacterium sp. 236(2023)]